MTETNELDNMAVLSDEELRVRLQQYSDEFDLMCEDRHQKGSEKYGAGTFLQVDTLEMALEEIVDLANYARYTFIRLRMLQEQLGTDRDTSAADHNDGFVRGPVHFESTSRRRET